MGDKKKNTPKRRVALYRKYRSKSLDEIVGQPHITKTLANAIKLGKLSHAYLFTGPRGTGKTSIARILAHEINGIPYTDDATHLDIIEIDAASNRRIDDIRDLREKVHIAPLSVKYKVYIIDEVHMLTSESFNALLKTLEEPPEHVIFILATTEAHKLPATIISRTQRHSFKAISVKQVVEHLAEIAKKENIKISQEALELLARHGGGSFRDSISLLDQLSTQDSEVTAEIVELLLGIAPADQLKKLIALISTGDPAGILAQVDSLIESGLTPSGIANQLAGVIRDSIIKSPESPQYVPLLEKLLLVHGATYQKLMLDSVLLGACQISPPKQIHHEATKPRTSTARVEPGPSISKPAQSLVSESKPSATPGPANNQSATSSSAQKKTSKIAADLDIIKAWPDILASIKQKNNPLYTVLRLAHPDLFEDTLTLKFSFPFHQKRVEDMKNKIVIATAVQEVTGLQLEIQTKLDKDLPTPEPVTIKEKPPEVDPAHASVIDSVRDIMGGGEVVHV